MRGTLHGTAVRLTVPLNAWTRCRYELVSSDVLKQRENESLEEVKARKKAEAKIRKLVTIDDARRKVWTKYVPAPLP